MVSKPSASYSVEAVSNTVLEYAEKCGRPLGPMKLQKLMYMMHGYYLAATGRPLLNEFFEAWRYGPVVPTAYHDFKDFGRESIPKGFRAREAVFTDGQMHWVATAVPPGDEIFDQILHFVFEKYGDKSAIYLSDLTHKVGSPWHQAKTKEPNMRNADIPNDTIQDYFKKLV